MTITRRHLLALSGGIAATAALSACGTNTGRTSASPTATGGGASAKPNLSQWYHAYGEDGVQDAVKTWASEFDGANVTVNWVASDYEKGVSTALLTDNAPDIFEYANGPTLDMIKAGQAADLTDVVGDAKDSFTPRVMERLTYQGKIWAVPQTVDMQLLYYRPSLLAKARLQPPTTLDALVAAAKAQKTNDMGGFFAGNDGGLGVLGSLLIWGAGLEQISADKKSAGFNDARLYAAVGTFKSFFDSGALLKSASTDWSDATPFINGETAMQWGGLWDLPKVKQAFGDDVGVLPFPSTGNGGRPAVPFGAFSSVVNAHGKNVETAKQFVQWLWVDSEDKQVQFSNAFGCHIPAKPKLFGEADKVASGQGAQAAKFVSDHGFVDDLFWTPAASQAYSTALSNVVKSGRDARTEFTAAADKVAAELKRVNG